MFNGNVRTVDPGNIYRSGQLMRHRLVDVLDSKQIKSVINLRGYSPGNTALNEERDLCKTKDIKHVDINMSAHKLPEPGELRKLLKAFDTLPRPILIHCAAGSDRSGLASTLYMNICKGVSLNEAESSQLTWRYGHISFGQARAMDDFFSLYRRTSGSLSMRDWILNQYPKIYLDNIRRKM